MEREMVGSPVTKPEEKASRAALSTADAPKTSGDRVARAIRFAVDMLSLALFVYCQRAGGDGVFGIFVFWLISIGVFPYASTAEPRGRHLDWGFLVLGVVIVGFGLIRDVGPLPGVFHGTPTNDSMLMGVVFALCGLTNLLDPSRPASPRRLLLGTATLVAGAIWLWFTIEPAAAAPSARARVSGTLSC
jgi:uncharacterized membrane protein HdeD (DUF308 family)